MTIPYVTGTVSVTAGSAVVTGTGTAWATALVAGGLFGLDSSNGNPVPILSVDSNTQLTLAKPWRGTTAAGQAYWIIRDTAYLQQLSANAQALATYIQRLDNAALAALASLNPAADRFAYFTGSGAAALATITGFARTLLDDPDLATVLATLGLTKAALTDSNNLWTAPQQFRGAAIAGDGVIAATFATERSWSVVQRGAGAAASLSLENSSQKTIAFSSEVTYTGPQIVLKPLGGAANQILVGGVSSTGHTFPSYSFIEAPGSGVYGYNTATVAFASSGDRCGIWNSSSLHVGARTSNTTSQTGTGSSCLANGQFFSFLEAASNGTALQVYLSATGTLVSGGRIRSDSTGLTLPATSDYRLKENVSDLVAVQIDASEFSELSSSVLRVLALRPVSFTWKDGRVPGPVTGFIAHEMQQVLPHAVSGEKDAMEDIGTATRKGATIPDTVVVDLVEEVQEDGTVALRRLERVIPGYVEPDEVYENTPRSLVQPGFEFEKTGEIIAPQAVDHVQIIPGLVAAVQEMTMMLLESRRTVAALSDQVAALTARVTELET
ncbi:tail fiber domain-containing protein [Sinorhizobium meliloti]|uniref:tail fiber domain-containing protein n=1 Tax=Rhizobium meliloti TaxID=382 RepID=UPI000FDADC27|nr:tail fiber domain-containing protein [Sinorhizobium meliloti]RVJ51633.1 tail fiber domain-containing protein [Sinorhizobium meliloti]RVM17640.1 tail fiber domain-containing protein [Sinorhizobium meliloti]RVO30853.1 tail fiber domain-containing protein [Sinorhizobium meliloti]